MSKNYVGSNGFDDEPIVTKEKIYAFAALLVILGLAFIIFPNAIKTSTNKNTDKRNVELDSYNPIINSNNDTDGDGIPNWQEQIYGTNPNVPDADKIPLNVYRSGNDTGVSSSTNLTDAVARDIYVAGQYVKNGNGAVDPTVIASAISKSVISLATDPSAMKFKTVDTTDINIIKKYFNDTGRVFVYILGTKQKELDVFAANLESGSSLDYINSLVPTFTEACNYLNTYKTVPSQYADMHTRLLKICNTYSGLLVSMLNANSDPVRAAAYITLYKNNINDLYKIFIEYKNEVNNQNIVYRSNEYGYLFNAIK